MKKQEFLDQFIATAVGQSILGQAPGTAKTTAVDCYPNNLLFNACFMDLFCLPVFHADYGN
ncbi:hypothetical protein [Candidatus Sororendozoicomonas aggregata]|uniref:hypothetical protein n=1 Tax=Candidatus Sororendozoicomonas aggregata TaxID=3073239 RepID=UPI002ED63790